MKMLRRILIANRGEIAVRIIKTLKRMNVETIAVYSVPDTEALHTRVAGQSFLLKGEGLEETYMNSAEIINIALLAGADAIHPGYGFMSENAEFAEAVNQAGLTFIGPGPDVIRLMGDKNRAAKTVSALGVPVLEQITGITPGLISSLSDAGRIDFPVMIKASFGGGGKAMRKAENMQELAEGIEISAREAKNYFGNPALSIEKYCRDARHIEVQVLADNYGNIIVPGERECSVQRRYQKVIEETPSVFLNSGTRKRLFETSVHITREIGYVNAGTIEYLVDKDQNFYFLEMNTRIQVEHPVTEMVTGIDMVEQQIRIAANQKLAVSPGDIMREGHAIQARVYAENPCEHFLPSPGMVYTYHEPSLPGVRIDSGIDGRSMLHPGYDPLIAKVIATGQTRDEAIMKLRMALKDLVIAGPITNRLFLQAILSDDEFVRNTISTEWLENATERITFGMDAFARQIPPLEALTLWLTWTLKRKVRRPAPGVWQQIGYWRQMIRKSVVFAGRQFDMLVGTVLDEWFEFDMDGDRHRAELVKSEGENIMLMLDGNQRISGKVSGGFDIEDIVFLDGIEFRFKPLDYLPDHPFTTEVRPDAIGGLRIIKSPLHGRIVKLNAETGKKVARGELLFILDAMKIENKIISPFDGHIKEVRVNTGDQVEINQTVLVIE